MVTTIAIFAVGVGRRLAQRVLNFVLLLVVPFIAVAVARYLGGMFVFSVGNLNILTGCVMVLILCFLIFTVSNGFGVACLSIGVLLITLTITRDCMVSFHNAPFRPVSFLTINATMNITNACGFTPACGLVATVFVFVVLFVLALGVGAPGFGLTARVISHSFATAFTTMLLVLFCNADIFTSVNVGPSF